MTLEELQVLITANTTELKNELRDTKKELANLEREAQKKTNNIASFFKKMIPIGVLVLGIKKLTSSSEQAYKEQIQNETRLLAVMQQRGDATKKDIQDILNLTAAEQSLGVVSDEVQLAGAQELSTYIDKANSIKKLLPQLNNMIAQQYGYNATQEQAINIATMMGKVLEGQTGALSRYGYYFDENQEKILKFGTEEEKVATLTSIIHDSIGDVNEALGNTAVGKQIQLANAWSDVKEQLGYVIVQVKQVLIPVFQVLVSWLGTAVSYLRQFLQVLGFTAKKQNGVNKAIIGGASAETEYGDAVEDSTKKQNKQLASFDEMNVLKEKEDSDSGSGNTGNSSGIGGVNNIDFNIGIDGDVEVTDKIQKIKDKLDEFKDALNFTYLKQALYELRKSFEPFADNIADGLYWIYTEILVPIAKWTIEDVAPKFLNILSGALKVLNQAIEDIKPLFNWLWEEILKPIAEWTGGVITDVLDSIGKGLKKIADNEVAMAILEGLAIAIGLVAGAIAIYNGVIAIYNAAMVVCNVVTGIFTGIMAVLTSPITLVVLAIGALIAVIILCVKHWDEIKEVAVKTWNKIKEIWNTVADWFNRSVIQPIANFFTNLWNGITNGVKSAINFIKNIFNSVVSFFKNIISTIVGLFKNIGTKVGDVIGGAFKAVVNGVLKAIENILNFPIKTINKLINTINKIPGINIGTLPIFSLPRLAKGGVIDKPTLAEIGESGREVVMPLENNTGWISELAEEINERNNSMPTHITLKIGEDTVVDKFIDDIRKKGFETNGEVVLNL